jgi:hypothetical protein
MGTACMYTHTPTVPVEQTYDENGLVLLVAKPIELNSSGSI